MKIVVPLNSDALTVRGWRTVPIAPLAVVPREGAPRKYRCSHRKRGRPPTKTHCARGHALVDPNVIYNEHGRQCKTCKKARDARYRKSLTATP